VPGEGMESEMAGGTEIFHAGAYLVFAEEDAGIKNCGKNRRHSV